MRGLRRFRFPLVVSAALLGLGSCGDDQDTADSGAASGTAGSASGTAATMLSCEMATTPESCATANFGFCEWVRTSFVPADVSTCQLNGMYGGACVDFATADGCNVGNCGSGDEFTGGGFAIFYRPVEGGFEVARTTDCNPMTPDFAECPFSSDGTGPSVCECACYTE